MTLLEENLRLQNVYDLLYYTEMSEEQKQYWRSIREKYKDEIDKNQAFKNAWAFLAETDKIDPVTKKIITNDYQTLSKIAIKQFEAEKSYPEYFTTLLKNNPKFKDDIEKGLAKAATWGPKMAWPKRYAIYKELDDKISLAMKPDPQKERDQIKKSLDNILTVLYKYEPKMSPTSRANFYKTEAPYTDVPIDQYYTDQHIDDLLEFYKDLRLRPIEIELASLKDAEEKEYKKNILNAVKYEDLGITKALSNSIEKTLINDIKYLQQLTGQKITFDQPGYSNETFEGLNKKDLSQTRIESVNAFADRMEKITGQKIKFTQLFY